MKYTSTFPILNGQSDTPARGNRSSDPLYEPWTTVCWSSRRMVRLLVGERDVVLEASSNTRSWSFVVGSAGRGTACLPHCVADVAIIARQVASGRPASVAFAIIAAMPSLMISLDQSADLVKHPLPARPGEEVREHRHQALHGRAGAFVLVVLALGFVRPVDDERLALDVSRAAGTPSSGCPASCRGCRPSRNTGSRGP